MIANEMLHNLFAPNIITAIKRRRMKWVGHVARKGETQFQL
jgi:hypothetical protein